MQRFEFSLDRVLKVKRQLEELAEREQLRAKQAADAARARVIALQQQLNDVSNAMAGRLGMPTPPHQWLAAFETSERLGEAIAVADRHAEDCEARHAAAARERAQVASEVEALSTLRQQQFDTWRKAMDTAAQTESDEVGLRRWMMTARAARTGAA